MKQPGKPRPRRRVARADKPRYRDLADYITRSGDTQANIAARVGASQATVSKVAHGVIVPRALLAMRFAEYCGIPLDSFTRAHLARRAQGAE